MTWAWWQWQRPEERQSVEANRFGEDLVADRSIFAEEAAETFTDIVDSDLGAAQAMAYEDDAEEFAALAAPDLAAAAADERDAQRLIEEEAGQDGALQRRTAVVDGMGDPTPDVREAAISEGPPSWRPSAIVTPTEQAGAQDMGQLSDTGLNAVISDPAHPRRSEAIQEKKNRLFEQGDTEGVGLLERADAALRFGIERVEEALGQIRPSTPVLGGLAQVARYATDEPRPTGIPVPFGGAQYSGSQAAQSIMTLSRIMGEGGLEGAGAQQVEALRESVRKNPFTTENMQKSRAASGEIDHLRTKLGSVAPEMLQHIDRKIGASEAFDYEHQLGALRDLDGWLESFEQSQEAMLLAMVPDPERAMEDPDYWVDNLPSAEELMTKTAENFVRQSAEVLQAITDEYGIAGVEIIANVVLDPLNVFGWGLFMKMGRGPGLMSKLLRATGLPAAEAAFIKASDFMFSKAIGGTITKIVGKTLPTQTAEYSGKVGNDFQTLLGRGNAEHGIPPTGYIGGRADDVTSLVERVRAGEVDDISPELANVVRSAPPDPDSGLSALDIALEGKTPEQARPALELFAKRQFLAEVEAGAAAGAGDIDIVLRQMGMVGDLLMSLPEGLRRTASKAQWPVRMAKNVINAQHYWFALPIARSVLWFPAFVPGNQIENISFGMLHGVGLGMTSGAEYNFYKTFMRGLPEVDDVASTYVSQFSDGKLGAWVKKHADDKVAWAIRKIKPGDDKTIDLAVQNATDQIMGFPARKSAEMESSLRRHFLITQVSRGVQNDPHLIAWLRPYEQILRRSLPANLMPLADEIIESFRFAALAHPDSLPELAAYYGGLNVKAKTGAKLLMKYGDTPPGVQHMIHRIAEGETFDPRVFREGLESEIFTWHADKLYSDPKLLNEWFDHLEAIARSEGPEGPILYRANATGTEVSPIYARGNDPADLLDAQRDFAFLQIQITQARRRAESLTWEAAALAKKRRDWDMVRRLEAELKATGPVFDALNQRLKSFLDTPGAARDALVGGERHDYIQASRELIEIHTRYRARYDAEIFPLNEKASKARIGDNRDALWQEALDANSKLNRARIAEEEAVLGRMFPEFTIGDRGQGLRVPVGAPDQAVLEARLAPDLKRLDALMQEVLSSKGLRATDADALRFRTVLADVAEDIKAKSTPGEIRARQEALDTLTDKATDAYQSGFVQYPGNTLDAVMRRLFPYWIYSSRKTARLLRVGTQHPAMARMYADYFTNSEDGYIEFEGTRFQLSPFMNSIMAGFNSNAKNGSVVSIPGMLRWATGQGALEDGISGNKWAEKSEGYAGDIERIKEMVGALGQYPNATFELLFSVGRVLGMAGNEKAHKKGPNWDEVLKQLALGEQIPDVFKQPAMLMELLADKVTGGEVDLSGLRDWLYSSYGEGALKTIMADLVASGEYTRNDPGLKNAARQIQIKDEGVRYVTASTRPRSEERKEYNMNIALAVADVTGLSLKEVQDMQITGDPEYASLMKDPNIQDALTQRVGEEEREMRQQASAAYKGFPFREQQRLLEERGEKLDALDVEFIGNFREIMLVAGTDDTAPIEIYRKYQEKRSAIFGDYEDDLLGPEEMAATREEFGYEQVELTELRLALNALNAVKVEDARVFAGGEIDWAGWHAEREKVMDSLEPRVRAELERYLKSQRATDVVPAQIQLAVDLQRELYDLPRYYFLRLSEDPDTAATLEVVPEADQDKVQMLHSYILRQAGASDIQIARGTFDFEQQEAIKNRLRRNGVPRGMQDRWEAGPEEANRIRDLTFAAMEAEILFGRMKTRGINLQGGEFQSPQDEPRERLRRREEMNLEYTWVLPDGAASTVGVLEVVYGNIDPTGDKPVSYPPVPDTPPAAAEAPAVAEPVGSLDPVEGLPPAYIDKYMVPYDPAIVPSE